MVIIGIYFIGMYIYGTKVHITYLSQRKSRDDTKKNSLESSSWRRVD